MLFSGKVLRLCARCVARDAFWFGGLSDTSFFCLLPLRNGARLLCTAAGVSVHIAFRPEYEPGIYGNTVHVDVSVFVAVPLVPDMNLHFQKR